MIIHIRNEHPDMRANRLNAKCHLHVQHTTDTKIQRYKSGVLKKMRNIN